MSHSGNTPFPDMPSGRRPSNGQFASAAVSGNIHIGGRMNVRGDTLVSRNLRVEGWLDAPNIKGPFKGWFRDIATLEARYRHPQTGWIAIVGPELPAPVYVAEGGEWVLSETTGGVLTADAGKIADDVELLGKSVAETSEEIGTLSGQLTVTSGESPGPYDLAVADESGNIVMGIADGQIVTRRFNSADMAGVPTAEEFAEADLAISDEAGHLIAAFADGHIRTRLFDSSLTSPAGTPSQEQGTVTDLKGKRISFIGDSITTFSGSMPEGYASYYPKGDVTSDSLTYRRIAESALGLTEGANCSWSGSGVCGDATSQTSASTAASNRRIADLAANGTPDIIAVYIGINDFTAGKATGDYTASDQWIADGVYNDFSHAYALLLQKLMKTYPKARIIVCTLMDISVGDADGVYPTVNSAGTSLAEYNRIIRSLAEGYGLTVADMHSCGIRWGNMSFYYHDGNLHPNAAGHRLMGERLAKTISN